MSTLLGVLGILTLLKPYVPDFKRVWVPPHKAEQSPVDILILERLPLIQLNPNLLLSLQVSDGILTIDDPFWVDICEVNQDSFRKFLLWYGLRGDHASCATHEPDNYIHYSSMADHSIMGAVSRPVGGVSFFDAVAYCSAAGGRLPTSEEWEVIAGGGEGRLFPWGDLFNAQPWRHQDEWPTECGLFPMTDTPEGVHDLATGVSEWTLGEYPNNRPVASGGNAHKYLAQIYALNFRRMPVEMEKRTPYLGFRCLYDQAPEEDEIVTTPWGARHDVVQIDPGLYPVGSPKSRITKLLRVISVDDLINMSDYFTSATTKGVDFSTLEVSRREYQRFLRDPLVRLGFYGNPEEPSNNDYVPAGWQTQVKDLEAPVVGVDWWDAYAFASWAGGRLPTAEEWMYGAGDGKRIYPWGDDYSPGRAATRDAATRVATIMAVSPVGSFLQDATPYGILDLGGNVSEWTNSLEIVSNDPLTLRAVIKGGNFRLDGRTSALVAFESLVPLDFHSQALGIRLVFERNDEN